MNNSLTPIIEVSDEPLKITKSENKGLYHY